MVDFSLYPITIGTFLLIVRQKYKNYKNYAPRVKLDRFSLIMTFTFRIV